MVEKDLITQCDNSHLKINFPSTKIKETMDYDNLLVHIMGLGIWSLGVRVCHQKEKERKKR